MSSCGLFQSSVAEWIGYTSDQAKELGDFTLTPESWLAGTTSDARLDLGGRRNVSFGSEVASAVVLLSISCVETRERWRGKGRVEENFQLPVSVT